MALPQVVLQYIKKSFEGVDWGAKVLNFTCFPMKFNNRYHANTQVSTLFELLLTQDYITIMIGIETKCGPLTSESKFAKILGRHWKTLFGSVSVRLDGYVIVSNFGQSDFSVFRSKKKCTNIHMCSTFIYM